MTVTTHAHNETLDSNVCKSSECVAEGGARTGVAPPRVVGPGEVSSMAVAVTHVTVGAIDETHRTPSWRFYD